MAQYLNSDFAESNPESFVHADPNGDMGGHNQSLGYDAYGNPCFLGVRSMSGAATMNALGNEYASGGYKFDYADSEGVDQVALDAQPLDFYVENLHPSDHGSHPSQKKEVEIVDFNGDLPEAFTPWASKNHSKGAVRIEPQYKRGADGFAEDFSGYTPLWYAAPSYVAGASRAVRRWFACSQFE